MRSLLRPALTPAVAYLKRKVKDLTVPPGPSYHSGAGILNSTQEVVVVVGGLQHRGNPATPQVCGRSPCCDGPPSQLLPTTPSG